MSSRDSNYLVILLCIRPHLDGVVFNVVLMTADISLEALRVSAISEVCNSVKWMGGITSCTKTM